MGFIALVFFPLLAWFEKLRWGKAFTIALMLAAFGQILIGLTKLGGDGLTISDKAGFGILGAGFVILVLGVVVVVRKSKRAGKSDDDKK